MPIRPLKMLHGDIEGRAVLKLTLGLCLLAIAGAASSPAFETNPLIGKTIGHFRDHLPATLDKITDTLRGR